MKRLLAVSLCVLAGFIFACILFVASVSVRTATGAGGVSNGDVNGDGQLDVSDAVYMLVHLFKGGQAPVACADTPDLVARVAALEDTNTRIADALEELAHPCRERADRFADNGDGTVTDTCTGLMWQELTPDMDGDGYVVVGDAVSWQQATEYCDGLELGGHSDWRLPSIKELDSLRGGPWIGGIDPAIGVNPGSPYWSSTRYGLTIEPTREYIWGATFLHERAFSGHSPVLNDGQFTNGRCLVLAVRGP